MSPVGPVAPVTPFCPEFDQDIQAEVPIFPSPAIRCNPNTQANPVPDKVIERMVHLLLSQII
jgi:hypothetical protein